jgi:hypothetical protein
LPIAATIEIRCGTGPPGKDAAAIDDGAVAGSQCAITAATG